MITSPHTERLVHDERATAKLLGVSKSILGRWRRDGVGPDFVKMGSRVAYRVEDVERWLASNRHSRVIPRAPRRVAR
jgi:predicted DNA-binding transcriptional regulator AlpA